MAADAASTLAANALAFAALCMRLLALLSSSRFDKQHRVAKRLVETKGWPCGPAAAADGRATAADGPPLHPLIIWSAADTHTSMRLTRLVSALPRALRWVHATAPAHEKASVQRMLCAAAMPLRSRWLWRSQWLWR